MKKNKTVNVYKNSQKMRPLFSQQGLESSLPLTFEDSLTPVPNHPFCAFGVLSAEGERGRQKSVAFVVEDNYLLTCASNCYSHKHKASSNITFTINSNRKSGYDTYKISKVFIPQQYKTNIKNKRNDYNYALLYIQGDPKLKDKYGSIGLNYYPFEENYYPFEENALYYFKWVINNHGQLLTIGKVKFQQKVPISMSGGPLFYDGPMGKKYATGLVFMEGHNSPPSSMIFSMQMWSQLAQWVQIPNGILDFAYFSPDQIDLESLKDEDRTELNKLQIHNYNFNDKASSFFEMLPFTAIFSANLYNNELGHDLVFLRQKKFRSLKYLKLQKNNIGPKGCQIISSIILCNLRQLSLSSNPILDQGCNHLFQAKWPFLGKIRLYNCMISSEGLNNLMQQPRMNLNSLDFGLNKLNKDISKVFQNVVLPRIDQLEMINTQINGLDLQFLKNPGWKTLIHLSLNENTIGNKGCKVLKQANISLKYLSLNNCRISLHGVKWLCKANLTKTQLLLINNFKTGRKAFFYLSKTALPKIEQIQIQILKADLIHTDYNISSFQVNHNLYLISSKYLRWLFESEQFSKMCFLCQVDNRQFE